jgi:CBS domain-containing protein
MHVTGFMTPATKVFSCFDDSPIDRALTLMLTEKVSSIVVINRENQAVGIVTKTDLASSYHRGIDVQQPVSQIMSSELYTVRETDSRDTVADLFQKKRINHAVVLNSEGIFVGLVSSWDVAAECARDAKAWPWIRSDDGRIHA